MNSNAIKTIIKNNYKIKIILEDTCSSNFTQVHENDNKGGNKSR